DGFVEEARAWVAGQVSARGLALTGEWEQPHAREWSSALSFETTGGRVWFKVNSRGTAYEPRLVHLLTELVPGLVPEVLAVDADRAWSLRPDAGPAMRSVHPPEELWPHWERLLARYADAQLALAGHTGALLATGTPDLRPQELLRHFHRLRDKLGSLPADRGGLAPEQATALDAL